MGENWYGGKDTIKKQNCRTYYSVLIDIVAENENIY